MGFLDKMRDIVTVPRPQAGEAVTPDPEAAEARFLEVSFSEPSPDAVTCPLRFDRPVSPGGTSLFETPDEAAAWPAVKALLGIPGVHSVIGKGDVLVVARRDTTSWPELLALVQPALVEAFEDVRAPAVSQPSAPTAASPEESDLRARVERVIELEINPAVADHGGYITLLDVQGTRVFVHMGGGCQGCAMSTATLKHGVESALRVQVPEITEVLDTTDHAAGANPYFSA